MFGCLVESGVMRAEETLKCAMEPWLGICALVHHHGYFLIRLEIYI